MMARFRSRLTLLHELEKGRVWNLGLDNETNSTGLKDRLNGTPAP